MKRRYADDIHLSRFNPTRGHIMLGHYLDDSLHVSRFLNTGDGGNHGERERIDHPSNRRIVRMLATLRRAPIVDNSMVVVRLITVPIPCSDAYVSRSGGSSQIWMIIGRTRLIYEYRNGRWLLDEINLHYTTLSRLVASSIDAGGGNGGGGGHRCR